MHKKILMLIISSCVRKLEDFGLQTKKFETAISSTESRILSRLLNFVVKYFYENVVNFSPNDEENFKRRSKLYRSFKQFMLIQYVL